MNYWVYIKHDDRTNVTFPGIDWSNGSKPLLIVAQSVQTITIKIPGGSHFSSRGTQRYSGAHYLVLKVISREDRETEWVLKTEWLTEIPIRAKAKEYVPLTLPLIEVFQE